MKKWFSFNSQNQKTELVDPSKELFETSSLLFWTRGLSEWVSGPAALEYFLKPEEPTLPLPSVIPVIEHKEGRNPSKLDITSNPSIICPVVTTLAQMKEKINIKNSAKKISKKRKVKKNQKAKSIKKRPKLKALKSRKKKKKK